MRRAGLGRDHSQTGSQTDCMTARERQRKNNLATSVQLATKLRLYRVEVKMSTMTAPTSLIWSLSGVRQILTPRFH